MPGRHSAHHHAEHRAAAADARRIRHARGRNDGLAALLVHALHDGDGLRPPPERNPPWRTSSTEITLGSYCNQQRDRNRGPAHSARRRRWWWFRRA